MSEREKLMWRLLNEVIDALSREGSYYHLDSARFNTRIDLMDLGFKEKQS